MKFVKLIRRNLFRNKLRTFLMLILMAAIFFFISTLLSILANFDAASNSGEGQNRLGVQSAISLANPLPLSHEAKIAQVPGIVDIAKLQWLGAYYRRKTSSRTSPSITKRWPRSGTTTRSRPRSWKHSRPTAAAPSSVPSSPNAGAGRSAIASCSPARSFRGIRS
jgi:hypothetical protein